MPLEAIYFLAGLAGIAAAVLATIFIIPESKREKLKHPFWIFLHDLFNFKVLFLERILKFLYVLATVTSIATGSLMLFWVEETYRDQYAWYGYYGVAVLLFAPLLIRMVYELGMMFILLVRNTSDIKKKLGQKDTPDVVTAPEAEPQTPKIHYCTECGNPVGDDKKCTVCGKEY